MTLNEPMEGLEKAVCDALNSQTRKRKEGGKVASRKKAAVEAKTDVRVEDDVLDDPDMRPAVGVLGAGAEAEADVMGDADLRPAVGVLGAAAGAEAGDADMRPAVGVLGEGGVLGGAAGAEAGVLSEAKAEDEMMGDPDLRPAVGVLEGGVLGGGVLGLVEPVARAVAVPVAGDVSALTEVVVTAVPAEARRKRDFDKEDIIRAIDDCDLAFFEKHRLVKNGRKVNSIFANTRHTWTTANKNAAGKKRVEGGTILMYAVYKYAATTTQPGEYLALCVYLLTQCNVPPLADEKVDFLHFITMDAWLMALPEPERLDAADPAWFRRKVLFERVLKTQDLWISTSTQVAAALCLFFQDRRKEYYVQLLRDTQRMARLTDEDVVTVLKAAKRCADKGARELVVKALGARALQE